MGVALWVKCLPRELEGMGLEPQHLCEKLILVVHAHDPQTWEAETGRSPEFTGHLGILVGFQLLW